jgi:hypothetical protein
MIILSCFTLFQLYVNNHHRTAMQAIHQHDREIRAAAELYLAVMKKGTDHMRDVDEQIAMAHQHASNARKNNE